MKIQEKQAIIGLACDFSLGFHTADVHSAQAMMYRGTVGRVPGWASHGVKLRRPAVFDQGILCNTGDYQ
jgi:hypothetical protein